MPKSQFAISPSIVAFLILAGGASAIHLGGNSLKQNILAHPDTQVLQRDPPAQITPEKLPTIYVIREANAPAQGGSPTSPVNASPNDLFANVVKESLPAAPIEAAPIDYFSQLQSGTYLQLNAVMHNGAIINGRFIGVGSPIEQLAYPAPGESPTNPSKLIAPRLSAVKNNTAVITESLPPHRTIKFQAE